MEMECGVETHGVSTGGEPIQEEEVLRSSHSRKKPATRKSVHPRRQPAIYHLGKQAGGDLHCLHTLTPASQLL